MLNAMRILKVLVSLVILRKSNAFLPPSKPPSSVGRAIITSVFASKERDFYDILDIPSTAHSSQIKSAYRKLAKQWHPDANPDIKATERFLVINRAYEVLTDPELKKQYDEYGIKGIGTSADSDQRQKQYKPPPAKPIKGDDLRFDLDVDYETSLYGGQQLVQVKYRETCEECDGTGIFENKNVKEKDADENEKAHTVCQSCRGQGSHRQRKQMMIQVPQRVHSGNVLRVRGEGLVGDFGGASGDIYVFFQVQGGGMYDDPYGYGGGGGGGGGGYDDFDFHNVDRISHVEASVGGAIWQQPDFEQHGRGQQHYDYY